MSIPPYQFEPRRLAGQAATPQSVASTSGNSGGTGGTPGGAPNHWPKLCIFALLLQLRHCADGDRAHLLCGSVQLRFHGLNLWITFVDIVIELIQFDLFYVLSRSTYNLNISPFCYALNHNFFSHCDNNLIYIDLTAVWL